MLSLAVFFLFGISNIYVAELDGIISPASSSYLVRAIEIAEAEDATCLIIKIDTPGGLDESMREITKKILNARIPIVVYVAPKGARAASAGVFILYSSHIAAMAPGTNVGAAHPVQLGSETTDSIMTEKVTNDAVAYLVALAKERRRNENWAEKAVRESASIDASEALRIGVCEIVEGDINILISKLSGRVVRVDNEEVILETEQRNVKNIMMTMREKLLLLLTNPNIAYVLLLIGIYGLFFELQNPGAIFPGVAGAISLILGFYAMHLLPVNYAGVALIILSAILFTLEIYITSHGILTVGAVISLVMGSLILFESNVPYFRLSWEVIMISVILVVAFFVLLLSLGLRAQLRKETTGEKGMIGEIGVAKTDITSEAGTVFVHGEFWNATSELRIKKGDKVKVVAVNAMALKVEVVKS